MRLDLIAQVLVDAGLGTIGEDIFMERMDANCERGILLKNPIEGIPTDQNLPDYYKSALQAIIREQKQAPGDVKAKLVMKALTMGRRDWFDPNPPHALVLQIKQLYVTKLPIVYPRSDGRGIEWSVNMHADYVLR